ncbi:MAG: RIP metalloprotease RseP [candidate division WOR-3 bacterium]
MIFSSTLFVIIFISLLIFVHELGHLLAAKRSKIPVEKFSLGFGPALFQKKIGETIYAVSLIPIGGYIKLYGEEEEKEGGFLFQPLRKKLFVVLTGPFFNFLLGLITTFFIYLLFGIKFTEPRISVKGEKELPLQKGDLVISIAGETIPNWEKLEKALRKNSGREVKISLLREGEVVSYLLPADTLFLYLDLLVPPIVERVKKGSPAEKAGLQPMDLILAVNDQKITSWEEFTEIVRKNGEKELNLVWQRGEETLSAVIQPELVRDELGEKRVGQIGVWVYLPKRMPSPFQSVVIAFQRTLYVCLQTVVIIYKVIVGKISRQAIGGPVMIAKLTYEGVAWGWEYILSLLAALSLNLFIINLLPIPVVDGGRSLLFVVEKLRSRRFSKKEMERIFFIGYLIVVLIALFAFFNDIRRIFWR